MLARIGLLSLLLVLLAGCVDDAEPPELTVVADDPDPVEHRPLYLLGDHDYNAQSASDYVLAIDTSRGGGSGAFIDCGLVIECTYDFHWASGTASWQNETDGVVHITPYGDATPITRVSYELLADGRPIADGSTEAILYVNPFAVNTFTGYPDALALPFTVAAEPDPVELMLRVTIEANGAVVGLFFGPSWENATGVAFDAVQFHEAEAPGRGERT